jgi:hypothetical protein
MGLLYGQTDAHGFRSTNLRIRDVPSLYTGNIFTHGQQWIEFDRPFSHPWSFVVLQVDDLPSEK